MTSEPDSVPIAFPDVPEASHVPADQDGLPERSSLSPRERLIVDASAMLDVALRTAVASVIAVTMAPSVLASALRRTRSGRERETLRFYAELAAAKDPVKSFPAPTSLPRIWSRPGHSLARHVVGGNVENIAFTSCFEAVNPAMRTQWRAFTRNHVVRAQYWHHGDGPRPTLCVIHGFTLSTYLFTGWFLSLPWYYRAGYDVLLYTLPFHGPRAERYSPFGGYGYFARGLSGFAEATAQAVHDFRSIIDYLRHSGVDRIALAGISLGGYTAALVASVDDRLEAVITNCPVVTVDAAFDAWFPANKTVMLGMNVSGIGREALTAALSYHSPLNYQPLVPCERRLIITGLGDRFVPPQQAEMLWKHWDHCALHWFPGSHMLHLNQLEYLRRMSRFLQEFMLN